MATPTLEELERLAHARNDPTAMTIIKVALEERERAYQDGYDAGYKAAEEELAAVTSHAT